MSLTVKLEIRGLALCFLKPGAQAWTVLFPCDEVHDLWFKYPKPDGSEVTEKLHVKNGLDMTIDFGPEEIIVVNGPEWDDTDRIFNLNADYAHGDSLEEKRSGTGVDEIRMLVPYSRLEGHDTSDNEYFVQKLDFPGAPVFNVGKVSKMISIEFDVEKDFTMSLRENGNPVLSFPFEYFDGSMTLEFNNDCLQKCKYNDFMDLYHLVSDLNGTTQFAAGEINTNLPFGPSLSHKGLLTTQYGNCDPAWSDPPPGP